MTSIVETKENFDVRAGQMRSWDFFSNISSLAACIPGCESIVVLDDRSARLRVRLKVGYISKSFELKTTLNEMRPPFYLSFTGESPDATITGTLELESEKTEGESCHVSYTLQIRALSVTGKTAIAMIGKDLVRRQATEFANCVSSKLKKGN